MNNPSLLQDALLAADNARIADDEPSWEELLEHLNALAEQESLSQGDSDFASELCPFS